MGREIDERVVEMRFDNRQFEQNVQTSMGTIDKLKDKLNFKGMSKGLDDVNASVKRVDMSPIAASAEKVGLKFSAMYTIADQALRNITNSAMFYGKRIVSALTIDPIKTGLNEYETKMNAIQVMQANTRGKNTMEDITKALDDLNTYADKTIYNFAQMTSNVGKFTAQGYDVFEAANAVKGLANLAAASGASAEDMARATYQMSQALGGTIRMIDWNSLRNANMATVDLKNTLIDLAKVNGIAIDDMIKKHGTFEQTLQNGWLTGEMFTEAMNIYSGVYSEAELKSKGFTDSQVKNFMDLAKTAESAATEVKTFTQLWDVLKETAQSGWTQTWEIIFGDFEAAKKMWTTLQNYLSGIINGWSDARNSLLGGALNMKSPWKAITDKLEKVTKVADKVKDAADKVKYFQDVVNDVWKGTYKNSDTGRYELLEKEGYDHRVVQDLVNKGREYKLTIEDIEESHKKFGLTMEKTSEDTKDATSAFTNLTDEQLRNAGLTEGEIKLYRDLAEEAERTGKSIGELADEMSKTSGRDLLIDSLKNAWSGLLGIFKALKNAWREIFPPMSVVQLYKIIQGINDFSKKLRLTNSETGELTSTAKKLQRAFKGVFALLDIILTLIGGPLKIGLKIFGEILGMANMDILTFAAYVGDAIVQVRDWLDGILDFGGATKKIIKWVQDAGKAIGDWFKGMKDSDNIGKYFIDGIIAGFKYVFASLIEACKNIGRTMLDTIKEVLDINSPSEEAKKIGIDFIKGLALGIWNGIKMVVKALWDLGKHIITTTKEILTGEYDLDADNSIFGRIIRFLRDSLKNAWEGIVSITESISNYLKGLDFGTLLAGGIALTTIITLLKIVNILDNLVGPLGEIEEILESVDRLVTAKAWEARSKAFMNFAIAIGILAVAVGFLTMLDVGKMWSAVGAIAVLGAVLGGLMYLMGLIAFNLDTGEAKAGIPTLLKMTGIMLGMSLALLIMAKAAEKLSEINWGALGKTGAIVAAISAIFGGLIAITKFAGEHADKVGPMLVKLSISLLIMLGVAKLAKDLSVDDIKNASIFIGAMLTMFSIMMVLSKFSGRYADKFGNMAFKMSIALIVMVGVMKLASKLDHSKLSGAYKFVAAMVGLFSVMMVLSKFAGENASGAGSLMLKMSIALLLMIAVAKLSANLKPEELKKAALFVAGISVVMAGLIAISKLSGEHASKAGSMILKMSVALLVIAGALILLSRLKPEELKGPLIAIGVLMSIMTVMIGVSKLATDSTKSLFAIALVVAILSGVLIALTAMDNPEGVMTAAKAMSMLMIVLGVLMFASGKAGTIKQSIATLVALIGLAAVMYALSKLLTLINDMEVEKALPNAIAIMALLTGMLLVSAGLGLIGRRAGDIAKGSLAMTLLCIPMALVALILGLMSNMNVQNGVENAIVLAGLLVAMTGVAAAMAGLGRFATQIALGALAMTVLTAPLALLGLILAMMSAMDVKNAMPNAIAIGGLLVVLTGVAAAMALLGVMWMSIVMGGVALAALTVPLALIALILAMMSAMNVENAIPNTKALVILLGALTLVAAAMALLGLFAMQIGLGALALTALAVPLATLGLILAMMTAMGVEDAIPNAKALAILLGVMTIVAAALALLGPFAGAIALGAVALAALAIPIATLPGIGKNISDFIRNIGAFGETEAHRVRMAADAVSYMGQALSDMPISFGAILADLFGGGAGDQMVKIGKALSKFYDEIADIDMHDLKTAVDCIAYLSDTLNDCGIDKTTVSNFKEALEEIGDAGVESFIKAFEDAKPEVQAAGEDLVESFIEGVDIKSQSAKEAMAAMSLKAVNGATDSYDESVSAGKYLVAGFANGIGTNTFMAVARARAMARAAIIAAEEALDINSPSKEGYKLGDFFGVAFVNAIGDYEKKSYIASESMANSAKKGLSDAIKRAADAINSDVDAQPTIRPVLDLSDVESGVGVLNGLFSGNSMLGVSANVGAISTMMSRRNQNGTTDDVVSAINKLDKDIRNLEKPSYVINGVTYDDGSSVSEAVQAIVRALRVERRT